MNNKVNEGIRARNVVVIDEDGKNLGQYDIKKAISLAASKSRDLVQVSNSKDQTICKIMDYGKIKYKESKKDKSKTVSIKEMRLKINISDHDRGTKHRKIREFLDKKHKVKYVVMVKGSRLSHDQIMECAEKWLSEFDDISKYDKLSRNGNFVSTILIPN